MSTQLKLTTWENHPNLQDHDTITTKSLIYHLIYSSFVKYTSDHIRSFGCESHVGACGERSSSSTLLALYNTV